MRRAIVLFVIVIVAAAAAGAADLGNRAPLKTPVADENVPNPVRQGGDMVQNATWIPALPYDDSGTTVGYTDDYAGSCLYDNGAPDVVYGLTVPAGVTGLTISLCGSSYDTGLYVYNANFTEIACNDDYCGLQSQLDNVPLVPGQTYYIVVDGYSSACGAYTIDVGSCCPGCNLDCPAGGALEGEPPLVDNYVDAWNGGCNTPGYPFQSLTGDSGGNLTLCGVSGWYLDNGSNYRDTDWYVLTMGAGGTIEATVDAEYASYFFELWPQDCESVLVAQQVTGGPCAEASLSITGYVPGALVWFWAGPTVFADPDGGDNEYDYIVWFTGLQPGPIAVEPTTWSTVKALYE